MGPILACAAVATATAALANALAYAPTGIILFGAGSSALLFLLAPLAEPACARFERRRARAARRRRIERRLGRPRSRR